ncbi:MAG: hypothetical protein ABI668_10720 [Sphingorhabdus sp.]
MTRLKAPFLYFFLVYLGGFVLGIVREFLVTPVMGLTNALLIEMPIIAVVSYFAARLVLDRTPEAKTPGDRLFIGCTAFILLLIAEEAMAHILRGISIFTLWADFELLAAIANIVGLTLFMLMPLFVGRKQMHGKFG